MTNKQVFVSYASPDRDTAYSVVDFLEKNNISCFIAPRDVDPGKAFASNLMAAIEQCQAIVLIASDSMNNSEHVLNEVDVVVAKKKRLIPFFIEDFEMNDDFRYYLGRTHRIIAYPDQTSSYFSKLYETLLDLIPKKTKPKEEPSVPKKDSSVSLNTTTVFEYIPDRGIMVNPEDHQRNVSFRTDTFISMFSGIFDSVEELAGADKAKKIFYETGYVCGQNFARRLNSQWEFAEKSSSFESKLKKWCEFDSNVGWGKFSVTIDIDEESEHLEGKLKISECFIVDRMKGKEICNFVRGYCDGVIETLLSVRVNLECVTCPLKNKFKTECVFKITLLDE